jgi:Mn-containing catalase
MIMEAKKTRQDEIIQYLLNSKRELQEEIRNDVHTKEFKKALNELREKSSQKKNVI